MRKITLYSLAALALVFLSACPPRVVEVTRIVEVTPAPEVVKLVAWTIGPDEPSYYRRDNLIFAAERLNADFALAKAPLSIDLEATFDTGAWGDYKTKFVMAAEAKEAPDIILSGHEDIAAWAEAGFIISLDDYIEKYWDHTYYDIIPELWSSCMYKGVKYCIPQDTEARPMYFSKSLLKKLGWTDAEIEALPGKIKAGEFTLYDLLEVAKEAQDKGVVEPGHGYWTRPKKGGDFYAVYFAFGGQMQDPETGKLVLVKDAFLKHLKFHYDTVFTYKTTPEGFIGTDWRVWHETVSAADKILFWNGGTWHWAEWQVKYGRTEDFLRENVGFALFPAGEPGLPPIELSHPLVYMVTADSKHPDLAFRILTEASATRLNSLHAVESAHLAIRLSQLNCPKYAESWFLKETGYMVEYAVFQPNHPRFGEYDTILWTALSAVMAGEVTPEEALDIVVEDLKATLEDEVIIK